MTKELRRCPFCGEEAGVSERYDEYYAVRCITCGARTNFSMTKKGAIELWNRREPMDKIVEKLEAEEYDVNCNICDYDQEIDTNTLEYYEGKEDEIREAIEIVKGGAV